MPRSHNSSPQASGSTAPRVTAAGPQEKEGC